MSPIEITDDPKWTDGNFEIVTADNVRFKVKDYLLFWAVYVDMSRRRC